MSRKLFVLNILAGLSLGAVVGFYSGMSTSPVVGTLIGTLSAVFLSLLSLISRRSDKEKEESDSEYKKTELHNEAALVRIIAFSTAVLISTPLAIIARTTNVFGRSVLQLELNDMTEAGIPKDEALLILKNRLQKTPVRDDLNIESRAAGALRSARSDGLCTDLNPSRFADESAVIEAWSVAGGDWKAMANAVRDINDAAERSRTINLLWRLRCQNDK